MKFSIHFSASLRRPSVKQAKIYMKHYKMKTSPALYKTQDKYKRHLFIPFSGCISTMACWSITLILNYFEWCPNFKGLGTEGFCLFKSGTFSLLFLLSYKLHLPPQKLVFSYQNLSRQLYPTLQ